MYKIEICVLTFLLDWGKTKDTKITQIVLDILKKGSKNNYWKLEKGNF